MIIGRLVEERQVEVAYIEDFDLEFAAPLGVIQHPAGGLLAEANVAGGTDDDGNAGFHWALRRRFLF